MQQARGETARHRETWLRDTNKNSGSLGPLVVHVRESKTQPGFLQNQSIGVSFLVAL